MQFANFITYMTLIIFIWGLNKIFAKCAREITVRSLSFVRLSLQSQNEKTAHFSCPVSYSKMKNRKTLVCFLICYKIFLSVFCFPTPSQKLIGHYMHGPFRHILSHIHL